MTSKPVSIIVCEDHISDIFSSIKNNQIKTILLEIRSILYKKLGHQKPIDPPDENDEIPFPVFDYLSIGYKKSLDNVINKIVDIISSLTFDDDFIDLHVNLSYTSSNTIIVTLIQ